MSEPANLMAKPLDNMGNCALCSKQAVLRESHIVPEFCYKEMYDDKHRAIVFSPTQPDKTRYAQKGIRSRLLCDACETLLNDRYEKPFHKYWIEGSALRVVETSNAGVLKGIDYPSFKLFHLSVLFRACRSSDPNYSEVRLPPDHIERIRQMILSGDPGEPWRYPIMASAIQGAGDNIWKALVGPAHRIRLGGHWGYYFTFCGCQWTYITSSHPMAEFSDIILQPDGTMPIGKFPLNAIKLYRQWMTDTNSE